MGSNPRILSSIGSERLRREEALNKPMGSESIGFALLAKMGFKPGMSLGKKKEGKFDEIAYSWDVYKLRLTPKDVHRLKLIHRTDHYFCI